jgi:hypothetical protein
MSLNLIEIPLILMTGSLFDYMDLNYDKSVKCIEALMGQVENKR